MIRRLQLLLWIVTCALAAPFAALAASDQTGSQYSPGFPLGGIIPGLICNARKRKPIGGWLMLFYWQLYSGLLISAGFFAVNIQSYVPENVENGTFGLFLASNLPSLMLFAIKGAVATLLLSARTWDMLMLLRWVMLAEFSADVIGTLIDVAYFPDNVAVNVILTIIPGLIWLAYMFRSRRVRHIFYSHDWDVAVDAIHPLKLKMAT